MRAAVYRRFGGPEVVQVEEVPTPVPTGDQVVVRVHATVVGAADAAARAGTPWAARIAFGPVRPRIPVLGGDFAGEVTAVGPEVRRCAPGDAVLGTTGAAMGAHAEYVVVRESGVLQPRPEPLDPVRAAALVDATAMSFLRESIRLRPGEHILVNGASGAVGSVAVQLAKHLGATVTGTSSGPNVEFVRAQGADVALDYNDPAAVAAAGPYDVVFDAYGQLGYPASRRMLTRGGRYWTTVPSLAILAQAAGTRLLAGHRAGIAFTGLRAADRKTTDLRDQIELALRGTLTPHVEATYPLEDVAEAHRHLARGKRGQIVLTPTS